MANISQTPFMNLPNPVPGVDPGIDYANNLFACFNIVDQHDHSAGYGQQISPSGINVNADFPFNSNNATMLNSVRFNALSSPIASSSPNVGCLYVSGNELYYNDVSGNQVQITLTGAVNATSSGISSGTASAAFAASVLVVKASATNGANVQMLSAVLTNSGNLTNKLTLQAPTLSGSITETLPLIPASQSFMAIDTSGNMSGYAAVSGGITGSMIASATISASNIVAATITTTQIAAATIAQSNLAARAASATATAGQIAVSTGSGSFTTSSGSFVDVTGTTVTLVTTGRPVYITLQSTTGSGGTIDSIHVNMQFLVNGVAYNQTSWEINPPTDMQLPAGVMHCLVIGLAATTYTIKLQVNKGSSATSTAVNNITLVAWEI